MLVLLLAFSCFACDQGPAEAGADSEDVAGMPDAAPDTTADVAPDTGPQPDVTTPDVVAELPEGDVFEPEGFFVAVGDGGRRAYSVDGVTWTDLVGTGVFDTNTQDEPQPDILRDLAFGDGVVVAVGGGGVSWTGNTMVMTTTDGQSWTEDIVGGGDAERVKLNAVTYSDGVFVAVGVTSYTIRSEDGGVTWEDAGVWEDGSIMWGVAGDGATFVAVGQHKTAYDAPKTSFIKRSTDAGKTWSAPDMNGDHLEHVAFGAGRFVAVGPSRCSVSTDGASWSDCGLPSGAPSRVDFAGGQFFVGLGSSFVTSPDGQSWSAPVAVELGAPADVAFGNGRWVALRWTERGVGASLETLAYAPHLDNPLRRVIFVPVAP